MKKPQFNNQPNQCIQQDGRDYWISRSVAVVGVVCVIKNRNPFFLVEKRSQNMDAPGLWCVPSGYIDWNENGVECFKREVYEETTLDVDNLDSFFVYMDNQPFFVKTDPGENRQNIVLNYSLAILDNYKLKKVLKTKNDEIDELRIISLDDLDQYQWAFEHDKRIREAFAHLQTVLPGTILAKKLF
jgi:8-oxo-dGTP pyrophosphatase MutT (NUDIX family)